MTQAKITGKQWNAHGAETADGLNEIRVQRQGG